MWQAPENFGFWGPLGFGRKLKIPPWHQGWVGLWGPGGYLGGLPSPKGPRGILASKFGAFGPGWLPSKRRGWAVGEVPWGLILGPPGGAPWEEGWLFPTAPRWFSHLGDFSGEPLGTGGGAHFNWGFNQGRGQKIPQARKLLKPGL